MLVAGNATFEELGPLWNDTFISARELRVGLLDREVAIGLLRQPIPVSEGFSLPRRRRAARSRRGDRRSHGRATVSHAVVWLLAGRSGVGCGRGFRDPPLIELGWLVSMTRPTLRVETVDQIVFEQAGRSSATA